MPRRASAQLTDAEQRIMDVLWARGEASVRQLTEALESDHGLAYTTVLTTVRIMAEKGHVTFRKDGRAHIYAPAVSRSGAQKSALGRLVDNLFSGSPQALAQHLIEDEKLTLEDIEALRAHLVEKQRGGEDTK